MGADRNLDHLYPDFRAKVQSILDLMDEWCKLHMPGHTAFMVEGFRTSAYQASLYAQGRTTKGSIVTQKNGTTNPSKHQSSLACDIVPKDSKGTIVWEPPTNFWAYLAHCARAQGLDAGYDWQTFKDSDHLEWKATDTASYAAAHKWQQANGLR